MANTLNYAQVWSPELLEIMTQETLCTPFITTNVSGWTPKPSTLPA